MTSLPKSGNQSKKGSTFAAPVRQEKGDDDGNVSMDSSNVGNN